MKFHQLLTIAVLLIFFTGCGSTENKRKQVSLLKFGLQFHQFTAVKGKSPSNLAELQAFTSASTGLSESDNTMIKSIYDRIQKKEIVVIWNAVLTNSGEENGKYILAYESTAPKSGGLVLDGGGAVHIMTAKEFSEKPLIPTATKSE